MKTSHILIKNTIRPAYDYVWKAWVRFTRPSKGIYPVAIQGIQRSGTNYLTSVLERANYRVLNRIDPNRNNPRHKHFRWQADKSTIKMDQRYQNALVASAIHKINKHSNYDKGVRHIVLFRNPNDWLESIYRWGLSNGWFSSKEEFTSEQLDVAYLKEWDNYYATWQQFADNEPSSVLIISYDALLADPVRMIEHIDGFMNIKRVLPTGIDRPLDKVPHSQPLSEERETLLGVSADAVLEQFGEFEWQRYQT